MIDTETLADGEFVTALAPETNDPKCPVCGCAQADWDCAGCGFEWDSSNWVPREKFA